MYGDNAGSEEGARMAKKLVWSFALSKEWLSEDTNVIYEYVVRVCFQ